MTIFLTGAGGFVGNSIRKYLINTFYFTNFNREEKILIKEDIVLHFAGIAHDLKKISKPDEYYKVNTELTQKVFDAFLASEAKVFLLLSSVKAVADSAQEVITENHTAHPVTDYGISKLLAEQYILSKAIPNGKRIYILRPCMIHGSGNKGNLNLLFNIIAKGFPWPLGAFKNSRSYLSIENLCYIIKELICNENIPSGVYNVADDISLSTNEVIKLIAESKRKKVMILNLNKNLIKLFARIGDFLKLPLNSEKLLKLTESYVVSNAKIKTAIGKDLPLSSKDGLLKTFKSFNTNAQ
jgi:nucleoside-diphosphate-sugar epimerase